MVPPAGGGAGAPAPAPVPPGKGGPTRVGAAAGVPAGTMGATWPRDKARARRFAESCRVPQDHSRPRGPWWAAGCGQGSAEPPILLSLGAGRDTQSKDGICARPQRVNFVTVRPTLVVQFGDYSLCRGNLWLRWCRHVGKAQGSEASLRDSHRQAGRRHCHRTGRMPSLSRGEQGSIPPWRLDRGTRPPRRRWQFVCTASRSLCCELG